MSDTYREVRWGLLDTERDELRSIAEREGLPFDRIDWHGDGWQRRRRVWFKQASDLLPFTTKGKAALAQLEAMFVPGTMRDVCWDMSWQYMQFVATVCADGEPATSEMFVELTLQAIEEIGA